MSEPGDAGASLSWSDFEKVDLRVGTIVTARRHPTAKKPAIQLEVDFGALGKKWSSAQLTQLYEPEVLLGRQVLAVVNFPPRRIGDFTSEVLVTGLIAEGGAVVLVGPDRPVPNGLRLA